jgi:hypothetical protein
MVNESDASSVDAQSVLSKATEVVRDASGTVQTTTRSIADAIEAGRRLGAPLDRLARLTREAPVQALAIAFIIGLIVARR